MERAHTKGQVIFTFSQASQCAAMVARSGSSCTAGVRLVNVRLRGEVRSRSTTARAEDGVFQW